MSYETQLTQHYKEVHQRMLNPTAPTAPPAPLKFPKPRSKPTITEIKVEPDQLSPLSPSLRVGGESILKLVAYITSVTIDEIRCSHKRGRHLSRARQVAYYLIYKHTYAATPRIGVLMNKDHTTVLTGIRKAQELLRTSEQFRADVAAVEEYMKIGDCGGKSALCPSCPFADIVKIA